MHAAKFALYLSVAAFVTTFFQSFTGASQTQDKPVLPKPDLIGIGCSVIDPIDEQIQKRFRTVDGMFGITRVMPANRHLNYFMANTAEEKAAVDELENAGLRVAFYLAGRRILGEKPADNVFSLSGRHHIIGGPVPITQNESLKNGELMEDLPQPAQLWDDGQKAMRAFETKDHFEFSVGKWKVEARPIRAGESCLKCHFQPQPSAKNTGSTPDFVKQLELNLNGATTLAPSDRPIKVGDPLGVAMYAYTSKK